MISQPKITLEALIQINHKFITSLTNKDSHRYNRLFLYFHIQS